MNEVARVVCCEAAICVIQPEESIGLTVVCVCDSEGLLHGLWVVWTDDGIRAISCMASSVGLLNLRRIKVLFPPRRGFTGKQLDQQRGR